MTDYRDISTLHNWEHNPRSMTKDGLERLVKQIKKLGVYKPLLITQDGTVLGGNMRLQALRELGQKEVWVSVVEADTEEKKIEYALSDNDRAGKYEADQLANLIGNFPDVEWNDFTVDIKDPELVTDLMDKFSETEEDEAPPLQEGEAESKLGEVYQLGRHRLMCGDSTDAGSVAILMNGQKADMVFTDPPYGVDYEGGLANSKKREKLIGDTGDITELFESALTNAVAVTIDKSAYYVFFSFDNKNVSRVLASVKKSGLKIKALLIWHKINAGFGSLNHRYKQKHEPFLYCCKEKFAENFYGPTNEVTVWDLKRDGRNEYHLTQKPVELVARAVKNSSKDNGVVLDLFLGSGSTLIACEQTNRICYGMELDPKYCDVIRKRYAKFIDKESEWLEITPAENSEKTV